MGRIYKISLEIISPLPADKLFRAFMSDYKNLIPKIAPHIVHSIQNLHGDGGPGTINKVNFAPGQKYKYAKMEVVKFEKEEYFFKFVVIEGDVLQELILNIEVGIKIVITPEGKSILKVEIVYNTKDEFQMSNADIEAVKKNVSELYQAVQDYFLDYPNA